jgi:hypothetical protein
MRPPLTPVPYARRTEPSKSLANGAEYTPAVATDIRATFSKIKEATRVPVKQSSRALASACRKVA